MNRLMAAKKALTERLKCLAREYHGGYVGMFQYLGFYDYEPVTLGKNGKIIKIDNCTPIENLLR